MGKRPRKGIVWIHSLSSYFVGLIHGEKRSEQLVLDRWGRKSTDRGEVKKMIPSLVRAAAPLARPVAKKMVPALSAAALATPTLMNADESEGGREGGGREARCGTGSRQARRPWPGIQVGR